MGLALWLASQSGCWLRGAGGTLNYKSAPLDAISAVYAPPPYISHLSILFSQSHLKKICPRKFSPEKSPMKTVLLSSVLILTANSASAIWVEEAADTGVDVTHCTLPNVKSVSECLKDALKKVKVSRPVSTPRPVKKTIERQFAITNRDVKYDGQPLSHIDTKDVRCLAYSIFREAGNQKETDQYAVGQVHMNRLKEGSWGKTMCKVVFAKAQFSWTLESKVVKWSLKQEEHFMQIAEGLMIDGVYVKKLASNKILHYHATYVKPKWAKQGQAVASAGEHLFYKNVPF